MKKIKKILIFTIAVSIFLSNFLFASTVMAESSCTQTNWYNSAWRYRRKIVINNRDQAENLVNFPLLVKLSGSNLDFSRVQSLGQDIRFTDSDGTTLLSYEIESFDSPSSTANIWVKVPQIDASSGTDYIYMYYGNLGAVDTQSATTVWNSNYKAVWHFKETGNGTLAEFKDSTSNGNNGQGGGGTASRVPTFTSAGQIGGAQSYDGGDNLVIPDSSSLRTTTNWTRSVWAKSTTAQAGDGTNHEAWTQRTTTNKFLFRVGSAGEWDAFYNSTTNVFVVITATRTAGSFDHLTAVKSGANIYFYRNGTLASSATNAGDTANDSYQIFFGSSTSASQFYLGTIDEARVSNTDRSAYWVAAEYKSESNTFATYTNEEQYTTECPAAVVASCSDSAPTSAPEITSITPSSNSVNIGFTKAEGAVSYYALEYGTKSGNYTFGSDNIGNADTTNYTVNYLSPGQTYYFRIRAGNGCSVGPWSEEKSTTVGGFTSVSQTNTPSPKPSVPKPTSTATPQPTRKPISINLPQISLPKISLNFNFIGEWINSISKYTANASTQLASSLTNLLKHSFDGISGLAMTITSRTSTFFKQSLAYVDVSWKYSQFVFSKKYIVRVGLIQRLAEWAKYSFVSYGEIVLDTQPTRITEVKVAKVSPTTATISWKTNHLSTSKVNFGETLDYGHDVSSDEKVHDHVLEIKNLKPGVNYYYEVMSLNKDYVYDAHHEFTTPEK